MCPKNGASAVFLKDFLPMNKFFFLECREPDWCILASHPAAPSLNPHSAEILHLYSLVSRQYWDWTHLVLSNGFHKCRQRWRPELSATKNENQTDTLNLQDDYFWSELCLIENKSRYPWNWLKQFFKTRSSSAWPIVSELLWRAEGILTVTPQLKIFFLKNTSCHWKVVVGER